MVAITEPMHGHEVTGPQKSDAQWIEVFAHYCVTQQHLTVETKGVTAKEGMVTQINPESVHVVGRHGAGHRIPFRAITAVAQVGEAEMPLGPIETRHIYEFAGFMARGEYLQIETADDDIARAEVRQIVLSGITIVDTCDGVEISVPFRDITHLQSASTA